MRLFQNVLAYRSYTRHLDRVVPRSASFMDRSRALIDDGFNGVHVLKPIVDRDPLAFFTCASDGTLLRTWAREKGMPRRASAVEILLAQIEDHRSEVFYTQGGSMFGGNVLRGMPGTVRRRIAWHSPPAPIGDLRGFDLIVNNFPASLETYAQQGARTAYFAPSFDPVMSSYCKNEDRPIDVAFVGGYTRHHRQRATMLEAVAALNGRYRIQFALDLGRVTRLAEMTRGLVRPIAHHARPPDVRAVSRRPVFGRDMYAFFSRAKIVLNGAVDSAAGDRGNMRCFEAMGCGALLLTDPGRYPSGMEDGITMRTYIDPINAVQHIERLISEDESRRAMAARGLALMKDEYAKDRQWKRFEALVQ